MNINMHPNNIYSSSRRQTFEKHIHANVQNESQKTEEKKLHNKTVLAFSAVGTLLPMFLLARANKSSQNIFKKMFNLKYEGFRGLRDMLFISAGSILGGVTGGMLTSKKDEKKSKVKEGVFQFLNIAVPMSATLGIDAISSKLIDKSKNPTRFKRGVAKVGSIVAGIAIGMPLALKSANTINNFVFGNEHPHNQRKIAPKDFIAQTDDIIAAGSMMFKPLEILQKVLPVVFTYCGYEAGAHHQK